MDDRKVFLGLTAKRFGNGSHILLPKNCQDEEFIVLPASVLLKELVDEFVSREEKN